MADLKAQLEISADSSGVATAVSQAKRSLTDLGQGAAAAGRQAAAGVDQVGAGATRSSRSVEAAQRSIVASIQRTTAVAEAGGRTTAAYFEQIAAQRNVPVANLRPYLDQLDAVNAATAQKRARDEAATKAALEQANAVRAQAAAQTAFLASLRTQVETKGLDQAGLLAYKAAQLGVTKEATGLIAQLRGTDDGLKRTGVSAAQTAAALRGVPAQFTDIVTSLQGGQAPLTVLLQQGGQLKDMFGGIGPAARALGGYVLGLVNPFTLAAGAAAVLGLAYYQGSKEGDVFARSIILSGNAAGTSVSQLDSMARSMAAVGGTRGAAADALAQFAATGEVGASQLERFATAALRMERETGQAVSKTVEQFAELGRSPVAASLKLNETTNFLTASLFQQIKALEDQGRASEAAAVAQAGYAAAVEGRLGQLEGRLGTIERGWRAVSGAAKGAWDAMLGVGRQATVGSELADAQAALDRRLAQGGPRRGSLSNPAQYEAGNKELRDRIAVLSESARLDGRAADAARRTNEQEQARIGWLKDGDQYLSKAARAEREIARVRTEGAKAGATAAEIEQRVAAIRERSSGGGGAGAGRRTAGVAARVERADVGFDIAEIRAANSQRVAEYRAGEQALEGLRQAGIISEADYYEQKRAFVVADGQVREQELREEIRRRQERKLSGSDEINNAKAITEAQSKLMIVRIENASRVEQLDLQQETSARRQVAAFEAIGRAGQQAFEATEAAQRRDLALLGMGEAARRRAAGIAQIEDRYGAQRQQVENDRARFMAEGNYTAEVRAQTEERLRVIDEFQRRSIESYSAYYDELRRRERDWNAGAREAVTDYMDRISNVAASAKSVTDRALRGMEDAFVRFAETGKLSFSDLARSIISDLVRITVQQKIMLPLMQAISSAGPSAAGGNWLTVALNFAKLAAGGSTDPGGAAVSTNYWEPPAVSGQRADGGRMDPGKSYIVGERGPERVSMGSHAGMVTPTHALAPQVKIINQAGADVQVGTNSEGELEILLRRAAKEGADQAVARVTADIASGRGSVSSALKSRGINTSGALAKRG